MPQLLIRCLLTALVVSLVSYTSVSPAQAQMITAHRGASHDAPENTMAAFNLAWEQGADAIEGDFYLTADGHIVAFHDKTAKRTGGVDKAIEDMTLAELQKLDVGSWKNAAFAGEPVPTFAEVLASIPAGKRFVVELKTGVAIVPPLVKQLQEANTDLSSLLIITFDADSVIACRKALPSVQVHWLTGFKQNKETQQWTPTAADVAATVKRTGAHGVGMQGNRQLIDAAFIESLREGGVNEFHVWTINSPADAEFFRGLGTIGITTDRPAFIRQSLEAAPQN